MSGNSLPGGDRGPVVVSRQQFDSDQRHIFRMGEEILELKSQKKERDTAIIGLLGWIVGNLLVSAYLIYTVW